MRHETELTGLSVGDACAPVAPDRAIFTAGPSRWYALRVTPQREDQAEAWLRLRGVYAFHPVLRRRVKQFGQWREYDRRYLPGYVFARFHGEPLVHRVRACAFITGALCRANGEWGVLDPSKLQAIHSMRKVDAEAERRRKDWITARPRVAQGDSIMFRVGPFAEMRGEVADLRGQGGVVVRVHLFGREHLIEADSADLLALRRSG
jgi:transcription antitermination factor NusG